jgi:predicted dehydrogenase
MADTSPVRVGFIGAGAIARSRHLPNLRAIPGVAVVAVSNRTRESAARAAAEFGIAEVIDDWRALLRRDDFDAVFIGTWPYTHKEMSVAALAAGTHVFCQARMAMNLAEAREMLAAARARPELVAMLCPPPTRMPYEPFIKSTLAAGRLGALTLVELHSIGSGNTNPDAVHWRERVEFSGNQIMAVGIYAETLNAWVGEYERLSAETAVPLPRKTADGRAVEVRVPQVVSITGRLRSGALAVEHHTGLAVDKTSTSAAQGSDRVTIWGTAGTLRYTFGGALELAGPGEELRPATVPPEMRRDWWAEDEFITAVRDARAGRPWSVTPDFNEGLAYMAKVEAVHAAARPGCAVTLAEL